MFSGLANRPVLSDAVSLSPSGGISFQRNWAQIFIMRVATAETVLTVKGQGHREVKCTLPAEGYP